MLSRGRQASDEQATSRDEAGVQLAKFSGARSADSNQEAEVDYDQSYYRRGRSGPGSGMEFGNWGARSGMDGGWDRSGSRRDPAPRTQSGWGGFPWGQDAYRGGGYQGDFNRGGGFRGGPSGGAYASGYREGGRGEGFPQGGARYVASGSSRAGYGGEFHGGGRYGQGYDRHGRYSRYSRDFRGGYDEDFDAGWGMTGLHRQVMHERGRGFDYSRDYHRSHPIHPEELRGGFGGRGGGQGGQYRGRGGRATGPGGWR